MKELTYTADIREEENGYWANFVEFRNAFTHADTIEELKINLIECLESQISGIVSLNEIVPLPVKKAEEYIEGDFSLDVTVNMDQFLLG